MRSNAARHKLSVLFILHSFLLLSINSISGCASSSKSLEHSSYRPNEIAIEEQYTKYEAIDKGDLHKEPRIIHYEKPDYPLIARQAGIEGTALLEVIVGTDGRVEHAEIIESTVASCLENSLLDAAKKFIYRPGERRLKPVRCKATHLIRFTLNDDVIPINID